MVNKVQRYILISVFAAYSCYPVSAQEVGSGFIIDFNGIDNRIFYDALFSSETLPITVNYWLKIPDKSRVSRVFNSCWTPDLIYQGFSSHYIADGINASFGDALGGGHPRFRRTKRQSFSTSEDWFHIAVVIRSSTDMDIYLNGIDIGGGYSGSGGDLDTTPSCRTLIGYGLNNDGTQFLEGQLDELSVWNFSLSLDQIRENMSRKLIGSQDGLIGYWKFDEGTGGNLEELISNQIGTIEGDVSWEVSGAPLGDESFFEYFEAGTKKRLFRNENDSFWISTESENWVGYHVYKVNEEPNSLTQSTVDMSKGYYGIFPIFEGGRSDEYRVDFGNAECTEGNFRNGNSDTTWEVAMQGDSSNYFNSMNIVEFAFETVPIKNLEGDFLLSDSYIVCEDDLPVLIESNLNQEFVWSTGESSNSILVEVDGYYWAEYTTTDCNIIRDSTLVTILNFEKDFLLNDSYLICEDELPFLIESTLSQNVTWNNGLVSESILVESEGFYWAEYVSDCGVIRDSVFINISKIESDFLSEDSYSLCKSDLPFPLVSNFDRNVIWSTGEEDSLILITNSGIYWAEHQSVCGIIRDSVSIEIAELNDVFIPNVLTPNNDGINDCFIIDDELSNSGLLVFNRAGVEIFKSNEYQNNWCPDDIPSGVYFYQIKNTCYQESFKGYISVLK